MTEIFTLAAPLISPMASIAAIRSAQVNGGTAEAGGGGEADVGEGPAPAWRPRLWLVFSQGRSFGWPLVLARKKKTPPAVRRRDPSGSMRPPVASTCKVSSSSASDWVRPNALTVRTNCCLACSSVSPRRSAICIATANWEGSSGGGVVSCCCSDAAFGCFWFIHVGYCKGILPPCQSKSYGRASCLASEQEGSCPHVFHLLNHFPAFWWICWWIKRLLLGALSGTLFRRSSAASVHAQ